MTRRSVNRSHRRDAAGRSDLPRSVALARLGALRSDPSSPRRLPCSAAMRRPQLARATSCAVWRWRRRWPKPVGALYLRPVPKRSAPCRRSQARDMRRKFCRMRRMTRMCWPGGLKAAQTYLWSITMDAMCRSNGNAVPGPGTFLSLTMPPAGITIATCCWTPPLTSRRVIAITFRRTRESCAGRRLPRFAARFSIAAARRWHGATGGWSITSCYRSAPPTRRMRRAG